MLTARLGDMGCLAEGRFTLSVNHFTTGLPGLDCLTIKCTKEIKIILPVPYGKEEKKDYLWSPYCVPGTILGLPKGRQELCPGRFY